MRSVFAPLSLPHGPMRGLVAACVCVFATLAPVSMASATPTAGAQVPAASAPAAPEASAAKAKRVVAKVDGMVCGMCVQAITKKLQDTGKVTRVNVDLKGKTVDFDLKEGANLSDDEIRKALSDAGYALTGLTREG